MVEAALRSGAADRPLRLRGLRPIAATPTPLRGCRRVSAACSTTLPDYRFDAEALAFLVDTSVIDDATRDWLAVVPLRRLDRRLRRGRGLLPRLAGADRRGHLRRVRRPRDAGAVDPQPRQRGSDGRRAHGERGRSSRPCIEMGSRRTHEQAAVASARAAYIGGFSDQLQPGRRTALGHPHDRHRRTRLHAGPRRRARRVPGPGRRPRTRHDVARRHLRRHARDPHRGRGRRPLARRDPAGLRRPADPGPRGPAAARRARRHKTRIVVTSDLDEFAIAGLASAPIDGYGVGTSLVTGSGAPTAGLRLQAGRPAGRRRRLAAGRQALGRQGLARRSQARLPAPRRATASRSPSSSAPATAPTPTRRRAGAAGAGGTRRRRRGRPQPGRGPRPLCDVDRRAARAGDEALAPAIPVDRHRLRGDHDQGPAGGRRAERLLRRWLARRRGRRRCRGRASARCLPAPTTPRSRPPATRIATRTSTSRRRPTSSTAGRRTA